MLNLDELFAEINEGYGRPALVGGACDRDGLLAAGATGVRRRGHPAPALVSDVFHIGSVSKAISATVLARLVDEGVLTWQTTTADVYGDAGLDPVLARVDVDMLLSHRSGLAAYTDDEEWRPFESWSGPAVDQREAFTAYVLGRPPASEPGGMSYSNAAYTVAAAMAERVTGERFEDLVRSRVFEPLGMTSAGFGWPGAGGPGARTTTGGPDTPDPTSAALDPSAGGAGRDPAPAVPFGHWQTEDGFRPVSPHGHYQIGPLLGPAGDMHMNVEDLARFARVHLRGIVGEDTIVSAAQIRALYASIGFFARDAKRAGYIGSAGTFTAVLGLKPYLGQAVILLTNGGDDEGVIATGIQARVVTRVEGNVETPATMPLA